MPSGCNLLVSELAIQLPGKIVVLGYCLNTRAFGRISPTHSMIRGAVYFSIGTVRGRKIFVFQICRGAVNQPSSSQKMSA